MTPVWLMRQAGRYLPEYRSLREQAGSFLTLCSTPDLACEVTLQPLERFDLDAAIIFSDILTIPHAMGLGLDFVEGEGPVFARPVRSAEDIARLSPPDPEEELGYVMDALRLVRRELDSKVPLIGFAGSPWTLAVYMIEGRGKSEFRRARTLLYDNPKQAHQLLDVVAKSTVLYLNAQIRAGAQALMLFDTWGGVLSGAHYREFSLRYMEQVLAGLERPAQGAADYVPIILFTKGGGGWLEAIADTGCDGVGLDWSVSLGDARARVGAQVALQGNLDPVAMTASPKQVKEEVAKVLADYGAGPGHVFNLGHGITPDIDPDSVAACVDAVHACSVQYHGGKVAGVG
ncbi:MAG: uroporphyrinogen decarboxylase [Gammaproteobacteria bacterium]|nr:uroporphyrinogen decarboxylase [Gammaproteobacteria bacterium]